MSKNNPYQNLNILTPSEFLSQLESLCLDADSEIYSFSSLTLQKQPEEPEEQVSSTVPRQIQRAVPLFDGQYNDADVVAGSFGGRSRRDGSYVVIPGIPTMRTTKWPLDLEAIQEAASERVSWNPNDFAVVYFGQNRFLLTHVSDWYLVHGKHGRAIAHSDETNSVFLKLDLSPDQNEDFSAFDGEFNRYYVKNVLMGPRILPKMGAPDSSKMQKMPSLEEMNSMAEAQSKKSLKDSPLIEFLVKQKTKKPSSSAGEAEVKKEPVAFFEEKPNTINSEEREILDVFAKSFLLALVDDEAKRSELEKIFNADKQSEQT